MIDLWAGLLLLVAWAADFIWRTSALIDGRRYFLLFDDGMISMRYARNLAEGAGLVFNLGERIEGITNPLWTLLMAAMVVVAGPHFAPLAVQIVGLMLLLTAVAFFHLAVSRFVADRRVAVFGLVMVCGYFPLAYWSLGGMEVSALAALTAFTVYFASGGHRHAIAMIWSAICIAFLLRPDGFLTLLPLLFLERGPSGPQRWHFLRRHAAGAIFFAVIVIASSLLRYSYYGAWVPNTYMLKVAGYALDLRISNGLGYIAGYLGDTAILWGLAVYGLFRHPRQRELRVLFAMPVIVLAYQVYVGGDALPNWRQLAPSVIVLIMVATAGLGAMLADHVVRPAARLAVSVAIVGLSVLNCNKRSLDEIVLEKPYPYAHQEQMVRTALTLNEIIPAARLMVFWAGTLPYYHHGYAIDALGKTDRHVAALPVNPRVAWDGMTGVPGHAKHDLDYSARQQNADYLQYIEWYGDRVAADTLADFVAVEVNGQTICLRKSSLPTANDRARIVGGCALPRAADRQPIDP